MCEESEYTRGGAGDESWLPLLPNHRPGKPGRYRIRGRGGPRLQGSLPEGAGPRADRPEAAHRVARAPRARRRNGGGPLRAGGEAPGGSRGLRRARLPPLVQYRARGRAGRVPPPLPSHGRAARVIRVRDLTTRYPSGTVGLDRASLDVGAGEFVALIGSSGAGKSTLLRCLNGLVTPTAGAVTIDGLPVTDASREGLRSVRASVGFVFQQFNLQRRLSVLDNILVGTLSRVDPWRSLLGRFPGGEAERARRTLRRVGLSGLQGPG